MKLRCKTFLFSGYEHAEGCKGPSIQDRINEWLDASPEVAGIDCASMQMVSKSEPFMWGGHGFVVMVFYREETP